MYLQSLLHLCSCNISFKPLKTIGMVMAAAMYPKPYLCFLDFEVCSRARLSRGTARGQTHHSWCLLLLMLMRSQYTASGTHLGRPRGWECFGVPHSGVEHICCLRDSPSSVKGVHVLVLHLPCGAMTLRSSHTAADSRPASNTLRSATTHVDSAQAAHQANECS